MSTPTTNYGFIKPALTDDIDQTIQDLGDNFDDIDTELKSQSDSTTLQLATHTTQIADHEERLDDQDGRIDNIIAQSGTSDTEVVDARHSAVKDKTFTVIKDRFEELETDVYSADYSELLTQNASIFTQGTGKNSIGSDIDVSSSVVNGQVSVTVKAGNSVDITPYQITNWRRCNVADDKTVNAYYGDAGYIEDGSNGQVMVEIHKGYVRTEFEVNKRRDYISETPAMGFVVHPAFIRNGVVKDKIYIGAYEASIRDVSASAYLANDEQVADFTTTTGDKLCSIVNVKPCSGLTQDLTLPKARILAHNRGIDWELQDFWLTSFIQTCLFIEHGKFDSQTVIGNGVTNVTDDGATNMAINTGYTSSLGNATGESATVTHYKTGQSVKSVSYHGIENLWGNIWKWIDGININNNVPYVADHGFQSDKFTDNYTSLGVTLSNVNGYVQDWAEIQYGFLPKIVGTNKIGDYYYQSTGLRVALLGGYWIYGSYAGVADWYLHSSSAIRIRYIGARLMLIP